MDKMLFYFCISVLFFAKDVSSRRIEPIVQKDNSSRIVGGEDTTIEMFPYMAYLLISDGRQEYQCGGSILSEKYILTAAHCLDGMQSAKVRIGATNRHRGGTRYDTETLSTHPMYNPDTLDFDVGVLTIEEGMDLDGTTARPVAIDDVNQDPQEEEVMTITGWGTTSEGGRVSDILQVAQVPVVDRADCRDMIGEVVTTRMFCAGYEEGGVDTCQGDSGGPAVTAATGRQSGITSFGFGCANPESPGVYTVVGQFFVRLYIYSVTGL